MIPKKLALINDISGFGRCSMTVAIPVLSVCGVQPCPVVTSVFSNHMGYPSHYRKDLTPILNDYLNEWDHLSLFPDGVLCGYLNRVEQLDIIGQYLMRLKEKAPDCMITIDPVMGDHGNFYHSMTDSYCDCMRKSLYLADLITPNLTEACFLAKMPYPDSLPAPSFLSELCEKLHTLGPGKIILTGIHDESSFYNYISVRGQALSCVSSPITGTSRPGTGDIFSAIVSSLQLKERSLDSAVAAAARFLSHCIKITEESHIPVCEGVLLENALPYLFQLLN